MNLKGKISDQTYEEWNRETGGRKLPERAGKKKRVAKKTGSRKKKTRKTGR